MGVEIFVDIFLELQQNKAYPVLFKQQMMLHSTESTEK
jgi:hypothetical protein